MVTNVLDESYLFGDVVYDASVRSLIRAISSWVHWIRTGLSDLREDAQNDLLLAISGFDSCGRVLDSMILRLLLDIMGLWHERSPWNLLSPVLVGEFSTDWALYIRLLASGNNPITEFWRSQLQLVPDVLNIQSGLVISLPTSAGKTRLAELAIANELTSQAGRKAVYVVPTRALASEIEQTLSLRLGPMNFGVAALYGGYDLSDFEETMLEKNRILVLTPEKLDLLMRRDEGFCLQLCLVVVDEGHQVASGPRGLRLEYVLSRIRWHGQKYGTKFLFLSAVLPNGEEMATWLAGDSGASRNIAWKPARARQYGFFWGGLGHANDGQLFFLEDFPKEIEPFIPGLVNRRTVATRDEVLARLAFHFARIGPTMVFTINKRRVEAIVRLLLINISGNGSLSNFQNIIESETLPVITRILGKEHLLSTAMSKGIAFHHGALPNGARRMVEQAIRTGSVPLFVANETLAAGVNLPVKNIIVDTVNRGDTPMSVRDFANVVGRAGRAGKETEANIIFLPDNKFNFPSYLDSFVDSKIEPSESQILTTAVETALPPDKEWMSQWWAAIESRGRFGRGFLNPWVVLVENCTQRILHRIGEQAADEFRYHLREALAHRLRPTYSSADWKKDKPIRRRLVLEAVRRSVTETQACSVLLDVDSDNFEELNDVLDSQIIALAMEEIFDPADPESFLKFIPFTLLGAHRISSEEMKRQYAHGLRKRFNMVATAVPHVDIRRKFNRTGLSLRGNQFLLSNVPAVKNLILDWINDPLRWTGLLEGVIEIVDKVDDLKPKKGLERSLAVVIAWLRGDSLNQIAMAHFHGDLTKATQVTESSISGLLPWGVNSLLELVTEDDFKPREMSPFLRNLPGMVAFGLPNPFAAYSYALGLNDREIAQNVSDGYASLLDDEMRLEFSFAGFVQWFATLYENPDLLKQLSKGDAVASEIIRRASESRAIGFAGKMRRGHIDIPKKFSSVFTRGEEVLLHKINSSDREWLVLDYLNHPRLKCSIDEMLELNLQQHDWIAKWEITAFGTRVDITFVG